MVREGISIRHVREAMEVRENVQLGPIRCFVVNFDAPQPYPKKFTYLACSRLLGTNRPCSKAIEGPYKCDHNSLERGTWEDCYRFDVWVADGSIGPENPPLRIALFDAAKSLLLQKSAGDFSLQTEAVQVASVKGVIDKMPLVDVWIKVKEGRPTAETLSYVVESCNTPPTISTAGSKKKTPLRGAFTPRKQSDCHLSSVYATQASDFSIGSSSRVSIVGPEEFATLKARVAEMEEVLGCFDIARQ